MNRILVAIAIPVWVFLCVAGLQTIFNMCDDRRNSWWAFPLLFTLGVLIFAAAGGGCIALGMIVAGAL